MILSWHSDGTLSKCPTGHSTGTWILDENGIRVFPIVVMIESGNSSKQGYISLYLWDLNQPTCAKVNTILDIWCQEYLTSEARFASCQGSWSHLVLDIFFLLEIVEIFLFQKKPPSSSLGAMDHLAHLFLSWINKTRNLLMFFLVHYGELWLPKLIIDI